MRTRSLAVCLGIFACAPALFPQARVADSLRSVPPAETVPVFLFLHDQPQRDIVRQEEASSSFYLDLTQRRLRSVIERGDSPAGVASARAEADNAITAMRARAFRAIETALDPGQSSVETLLRQIGARHVGRYKAVNVMTAEIPAGLLDTVAAHPAIAEILPAITLRTQLATSVPGLGAPAFWNAGFTGSGQAVAVIDSGIAPTHPAFAGKTVVAQVFLTYGALNTQCFGDDPSSPVDQLGHGTHVNGIAGSQGSVGFENYKGVAPGASLYSLKAAYRGSGACGGSGLADSRDIQAAIDWMLQNSPARIVNMSLGSPEATDDDSLSRYMDTIADSYGVLFAMAAGNGTNCRVHSPGHAYNVLSVANYQTRGGTIYSTCGGPNVIGRYKPDLAAPGTGIVSTAWNWETGSDYLTLTGTSMASPHIAGSAALLANAGVIDPLAIRATLLNSTDNDGWAAGRGWGYANLTTAQAQYGFTRTGQLAGSSFPGSFHLYELAGAGAAKATVAWNRHIVTVTSGLLNDIDLYAYARDTGAAAVQSVDPVQSVQQVAAPSGPAVVKVKMVTPILAAAITQERYGIAFNQPAVLRSGPVLVPSCTAPPSVANGASFQLTCSITNSGDLPAFSTGLTVTLSNGFTGTGTASFGTIAGGTTSASQPVSLSAPPTGGNFNLAYSALSTSFGETFTGSANVAVSVVGPPGVPSAPSPADQGNAPQGPAVLSWTAAGAADSYDVYFGTSPTPPLVTNVTGPSFAPGSLAASTTYYWRVVARNGFGSNTSPTWTFSTVRIQSLSLSANPVTGGTSLTGTVTLNGAAPPYGAQVALSSGSAAVSLPPVTVVPGSTTANFTINTSVVQVVTPVVITASYNGSSQAGLTVNPPLPTPVSIGFSANPVVGGTPVTGTVTLNVPAWPGDVTVALTSSNAAAPVPASVLIPAGSISAVFPVSTTAVTGRQVAQVSASLNGTVSAALTLQLPASSLIGWWKFDEGAGSSAFDSSNSAADGTLVGAPAWAAGRIGQGIAVNGTNWVDVGNPAALRTINSVTVSAWIKPAGTNGGQPIVAWDGGTANFYSLDFNDSGSPSLRGVTFSVATNTGYQALFFNKTDWDTSQWYLLTGSFDNASKTLEVYINGVRAASRVLSAGAVMTLPAYGTQKLYIGGEPGWLARGTIDEVRIHNAALTAAEIAAIFSSASGAPTVQVSSLALSQSSVTGGTNVTGAVTLSGPAPAGNAIVSLSSNNGAAAVPANVTVNANSVTAGFTISTSAVASPQGATITATYNGTAQAGLTVNPPPAISTVTFSQGTVTGGTNVTGTVTLTGPAPAGNATVTLASSHAAAGVPANVTVNAGATSANFAITTSAVASQQSATITAAYGGTAQASLTVNPPTVSNLGLSQSAITGGANVTGTVTLNGPAPAGNATVTLSSGNGAAAVPATVTVNAGATAATFPIGTNPVATQQSATLTASYNGSAAATLTVNPPVATGVSFSQNPVTGGANVTGTVTLSGPAPAGNATVTLSSSNGAAAVPASVTVTAGNSAATFTIDTSAVPSQQIATITAGYNGTAQAALTVNPTVVVISVTTVSLSQASVTGGSGVTGTVTLSGPAPVGNAIVGLSSSHAAATVPANVTVPAGLVTANFTIGTAAVTSTQNATITATYNGTAQAALTVNPPASGTASLVGWWNFDEGSGLNAIDSSGNGSTGILTGGPVWNPGRNGQGLTFNGTNWVDLGNPPVLRTMTSVTVSAWIKPAGSNGGQPLVVWDSGSGNFYALGLNDSGSPVLRGPSFAITTASGYQTVFFNKTDWDTSQWYLLTGSFDNATRVMSVYVNGVLGATRTLPAGSAMVLPSWGTQKVYIGGEPGWAARGTIDDVRIYSAALSAGDVTAIFNSAGSAPPPSVTAVSLSPSAVTGGANVTGTVTLSGPAPAGGALVALSSGNSAAVVPANVTVAAGALTANFAISTAIAGTQQSAVITATYNGTAQATLTINPQPVVTSVNLSQAAVTGGTGVTGSVTLSGPAPAGGAVVALSSNNGAAAAGASVTVNANSTTANFAITTNAVASQQAATITAAYNGSAQAGLTVNPPLVTSVSLSQSTVTGGTGVTGTVTLNGPAPAGGALVALASSNAAAVAGASVTVNANSTTANFPITTSAVVTQQVATITATYNSSAQATLTVNPAPVVVSVVSVSLSQTAVIGGIGVTGTVTLSGPAPAGGALTGLSSGNPAATVPANVTVPAGSATANFAISTSTVASQQTATITASYNGTAQATLTVNPPASGTASLVGWWKLDEGSGGAAADSSGNGSSGLLTGNPVWSAGKNGQGLTFNGSNWVDLGNPAILRSMNSVTVSAWIRPAGTNGGQPLVVWDSGSGNFYGLSLNDGGSPSLRGPSFAITTVSGYQTVFFNKTDWDTSQWYLLTGSYDNTTRVLNVYVNGVLGASRTLPAGSAMMLPAWGTQRVYIGGEPGWAIRGTIDDVRIYSSALSGPVIASIFAGGAAQ